MVQSTDLHRRQHSHISLPDPVSFTIPIVLLTIMGTMKTSPPHTRSRHSSLPSNSVPFPTAASLHSIHHDAGQIFDVAQGVQYKDHIYPATYPYASKRHSRGNSFTSSHRPRPSISRTQSTYSRRLRPADHQLSPVAEESAHPLHGQSRLPRPNPTRASAVEPRSSYYASGGQDEAFVDELTIAMMLMMPSPHVDRQRMAVKNKKAAAKRASRFSSGTRRVANAAGRAVSALRRSLQPKHH